MGKSIRSKKMKRLRTLKREIVEPYYDAKDEAKLAVAAAALAAPKITPRKCEDMEDDLPPSGGRSSTSASAAAADALTSMPVDCEAPTSFTPSKLKATGGISKRSKSKKGHRSKQVLKRKKKKGLNF